MKPEYYPKGWLRILDIVGIAIAPISTSLLFFLFTILSYQSASANDTSYTYAIALLLGTLGILILLGSYFGWALISYVNQCLLQRDGIIYCPNMYIFRRTC